MYTRIRRVSVLLVVITTILGGDFAHAQNFGKALNEDVRLDWTVAQGRKGQEIAGYISITCAAVGGPPTCGSRSRPSMLQET